MKLICFYLALTVALPVLGEDWGAYISRALRQDNAEAREYLSHTLGPRLIALDAQALSREIAPLAVFIQDPDEKVRVQAVAIVGALASVRADAASALDVVTPALVKQFNGSGKSRQNAVWIIATMRPSPPAHALEALSLLLQDQDRKAVGTAVLGLMRLAPQVPDAEARVRSFMQTEKRPDRLVAAVYAVGESAKASESTVLSMLPLLRHRDDSLVLATSLTFERLRGQAASALFELQAAKARRATDDEMVEALSRAISAITTK